MPFAEVNLDNLNVGCWPFSAPWVANLGVCYVPEAEVNLWILNDRLRESWPSESKRQGLQSALSGPFYSGKPAASILSFSWACVFDLKPSPHPLEKNWLYIDNDPRDQTRFIQPVDRWPMPFYKAALIPKCSWETLQFLLLIHGLVKIILILLPFIFASSSAGFNST